MSLDATQIGAIIVPFTGLVTAIGVIATNRSKRVMENVSDLQEKAEIFQAKAEALQVQVDGQRVDFDRQIGVLRLQVRDSVAYIQELLVGYTVDGYKPSPIPASLRVLLGHADSETEHD